MRYTLFAKNKLRYDPQQVYKIFSLKQQSSLWVVVNSVIVLVCKQMVFAYIFCFRTLKGIQRETVTFYPGTGVTNIHKPQILNQGTKLGRGTLAPNNHSEKMEMVLVEAVF